MQRLATLCGGKKLPVLSVRHLAGSQFEDIYPNTMHRPLVILTRIAAHQKPACGNLNHARKCNFVTPACLEWFSFLLLHVVSGSTNRQIDGRLPALLLEARGRTTSPCKCTTLFPLVQSPALRLPPGRQSLSVPIALDSVDRRCPRNISRVPVPIPENRRA